MASPIAQSTIERERHTLSGWAALVVVILWFIGAAAYFVSIAKSGAQGVLGPEAVFPRLFSSTLLFGLGIFFCCGFFTLEPNEARVLILFGNYKGSERRSGFHW